MDRPAPLSRRNLLAGTAAGGLALVGLHGAHAQTARRGGTLRISVEQAPSKLNPLQHRVGPEYLLGEMLYSGLTRLGPDMAAQPDLATSWSSNPELTEWTFRLRPQVAFHDGSALTAQDVVATFQAILDPATGSPGRSNIGPVDSVTAVDPLTVLFRLKGAYADLPVALAYTNARIIPAAVLKGGMARLDREALGTGPFRLVSYEPSRLTVLERNPDYYHPERPYLDRVEVQVFPDATARTAALLAGDSDLMLSAAPTDFARMEGAPGVKGLRTPSGQFLNVIMGCNQKPFDDVRVRRALALTIDREAMVELAAEGLGTVGADTPVNAAYRFNTALPPREANIAEAKKLLAEAGYPRGLELTLVASDRPNTRAQLGVALREMAKPAGFNINLQTMAHATFLDQVWLKGPFYIGLYNMQPTTDGIFSLLYASSAPWNESKWNNASFDKLVEDARRTADDARRRELYARAQKIMYDEVPTLIPVFFDLLAGIRTRVQGFNLHPRGAVYRIEEVWLGGA
ncbi:ABC transporter substrate-binding protein [Roseomonas sp. E05]|uniref:ABC transporter substrate-binding protein n=1 Tax=Roseomonas sp. E05 TaxID=3046310 RepID=UPI0024BA0FFC|nr:ABC transporter substrate-binding protein [Roseomonas sp. E05]MDJ0388540.1 ABC transporter substrate-binding protein [Roseomonas sp. E05]